MSNMKIQIYLLFAKCIGFCFYVHVIDYTVSSRKTPLQVDFIALNVNRG